MCHAGFTTKSARAGGKGVRIEVVTEGVLLRRLQQDRTLPGVGLVIIDEFHERSLLVRLASLASDLCDVVLSHLVSTAL